MLLFVAIILNYILIPGGNNCWNFLFFLKKETIFVLVGTTLNFRSSAISKTEVINWFTFSSCSFSFAQSFVKNIFSGWELTVEDRHVFLTKTGSASNESFAAIEHNVVCSGKKPCGAKTCASKRTCTTTVDRSMELCTCV